MENVAETLGKNAESSQKRQTRRVYKSPLTPDFCLLVSWQACNDAQAFVIARPKAVAISWIMPS